MKRKLSILLVCLYMISMLSGFSSSPATNTLAEKFVKTYFTVTDQSKIASYGTPAFERLYSSSLSTPIKAIMTKQAFSAIQTPDRRYSLYVCASKWNFNTTVDHFKITKTIKGANGTTTFLYEARLNWSQDGQKQALPFTGQLSIQATGKKLLVCGNQYGPEMGRLIGSLLTLYREQEALPATDAIIEEHELTTAQKLADFEYLYTVLKENYPFFDVNKRLYGTDWLSKKEEYSARVLETHDDREFFYTLYKIMDDLHNRHSQVVDDSLFESLYPIYQGIISYRKPWFEELNKPNVLRRYFYTPKSDWKEATETFTDKSIVTTEVLLDGKVAYIGIPSLNIFSIDPDMKVIRTFLQQNINAKALILDLRGNGGGDSRYWTDHLVPMLANKAFAYQGYLLYRGGDFSLPFYGNPQSTASFITDLKQENLTKQPPESLRDFKFYRKFENTIDPGDPVGFNGKIYILIDRKVYSSAEAFVSFSKHSGFATLVGETTGGDGLGIDPLLVALPNSGYVVRFSGELGLTADGTCNEEFKTEPDIKVNAEYTLPKSENEAVKTVLKLLE